jgi:hypothetical protein
MTASQKAQFTETILMALLTEQADMALIPGRKLVMSEKNEGQTNWISYPAARAAIEETMGVLIRSLANAHGIPASYPPMG